MSTASQVAPGHGGNPDRRPYLVRETPVRWRIEPTGSMRVPGVVFASRRLLADAAEDQSLRQVANVATLPGIVRASYAMPDVHWGYGFPIGGVAATDVDGRRGGLAGRGGLRHLLRGAPAGVRSRPRPARRPAAGADGRVGPAGAARAGRARGVAADRGATGSGRILTGGAVYAVERGHGVPRRPGPL